MALLRDDGGFRVQSQSSTPVTTTADLGARIPRVSPPLSPPGWAGPLGPDLMRRTQRLSERGWTPPRDVGVDPLEELTRPLRALPALQAGESTRPVGTLDRLAARIRVNRPSWGARRLPVPANKTQSTRISFTLDGRTVTTRGLQDVEVNDLFRAYPMRDFARRLNQPNHPTAPWIDTMSHLIGAESHLEGAFYLLADFHPLVSFISGQPFTLSWPKGAGAGSHTPDCLLATTSSRWGLVVDVKTPEERATKEWLSREELLRPELAKLGLNYMVWSGMPRHYRRNLEKFTEARVPATSMESWAPLAATLARSGIRMNDLVDALGASGYERLRALTLIRRMLWLRMLRTDLARPVGLETTVWTAE